MSSRLVSIVVPAFNQASFLGAAIRSVLDQSYADWELIIVNDASPDETSEAVGRFTDPRIRLITHERNRGLPAARNTGIRAASGDIIALLDADDFYHPDKLALHVEFLGRHPEVDVTYNARFNLHHSSLAVRDIWRPPLEVGLPDFVLGWPFSPSDMVARREPLFRVGLFDERLFSGGEDVDLPCRLALAGCRFASVDRALNYRRYHAIRRKRNLPARLQDYTQALETTFADARCPDAVRALRGQAFTNHYLELVFRSFVQGECEPGQSCLREAVRLAPELVTGEPCELIRRLLQSAIADESASHEDRLRAVVAQLPEELAHVEGQCEWAIRYGWLLKATRATIWASDRSDLRSVPREALTSGDEAYVAWAVSHIENYEVESGPGSAARIVQNMTAALRDAGAGGIAARLGGRYQVNQAFRCFRAGRRDLVPSAVARAIRTDPRYVTNRGVLSILLRSALSRRAGTA